ncbi:insertion element IS1 protein InsB [Izhakiella capsodis]|uniref:Insertion element IS1 protein InsB n=1 Tax=Izhakiella capsodis TaxID=1367852 RepID=A0A1I4XFV9_9GAMM|nr:insertion element IS1 protein InsB [Izhakiella capsodis]
MASSPVAHADIALFCEVDEQWAFVGSKERAHRLGYDCNTETGSVLAHAFGPGTDENCRELQSLLTPFTIDTITCDNRGRYAREIPGDKPLNSCRKDRQK